MSPITPIVPMTYLLVFAGSLLTEAGNSQETKAEKNAMLNSSNSTISFDFFQCNGGGTFKPWIIETVDTGSADTWASLYSEPIRERKRKLMGSLPFNC